ncbi:MAG: hypothetical protein O7D32_01500 [bacterium]|nr:hypothetical protein [bacterium]
MLHLKLEIRDSSGLISLAGAVALAEPKEMPWGGMVSYVRSVDGTLVGIVTPVGGPPIENLGAKAARMRSGPDGRRAELCVLSELRITK